jgi:hypothetical protein
MRSRAEFNRGNPSNPDAFFKRTIPVTVASLVLSSIFSAGCGDYTGPNETGAPFFLEKSGLVCDGLKRYTVKPDDTFYNLLLNVTSGESRLGVPDPYIGAAANDVAKANNIDPERLIPGTKIAIPVKCNNPGTGIGPDTYTYPILTESMVNEVLDEKNTSI